MEYHHLWVGTFYQFTVIFELVISISKRVCFWTFQHLYQWIGGLPSTLSRRFLSTSIFELVVCFQPWVNTFIPMLPSCFHLHLWVGNLLSTLSLHVYPFFHLQLWVGVHVLSFPSSMSWFWFSPAECSRSSPSSLSRCTFLPSRVCAPASVCLLHHAYMHSLPNFGGGCHI